MTSKNDKSQLLSFLIEEIDKKALKGTLDNDYSAIVEDGRTVGLSSYTINLIAKAAVLQNGKSPEIEHSVLPASFIYTHLPKEEQNTIKELEAELKKLKKTSPIIKKQKGRTALLIISIILFLLAGIFFLSSAGLALENNELNDKLVSARDSLETAERESRQLSHENKNLTNKISSIKSIKFMVGPNRGTKEPGGKDNDYVEWIEVTYPVKIESFYTWASGTGDVTIVAYDSSHQKIVESRVTVNGETWQKVVLKDFILSQPGKYYLCLENTTVKLAYSSSSETEYARFKQGPLKLIGETSINLANKNNPSINTGYYQYFYSIQYSLQ